MYDEEEEDGLLYDLAKSAYRVTTYGANLTLKNAQLLKVKREIENVKDKIKKNKKEYERETEHLNDLITKKNSLENELKNVKMYKTPSPNRKSPSPKRKSPSPKRKSLLSKRKSPSPKRKSPPKSRGLFSFLSKQKTPSPSPSPSPYTPRTLSRKAAESSKRLKELLAARKRK